MKASRSRPEIALTYEDIRALLAFALPHEDNDLSWDPKAQVLFRRVPYPENTSKMGTRELCQAIATDGTAMLVLEGPGSEHLFKQLRVSPTDLKRYCPKKGSKIWVRAAKVNKWGSGAVDFYDEDGLLNNDAVHSPPIEFPPWKQVLPQRVKRAEYMPAREVSLGAESWKRLDLVQRAVGSGGIMLRITHPEAHSGGERLDIVRFDTEPGKNGMRAEGALCGRKRF